MSGRLEGRHDMASGPLTHETSRRRSTGPVLASYALLVVIVTLLSGEVHDDPWILYRYAHNLAAGDGWTFNPGHQGDNAVTSPLTVLLLAAAAVAHVPTAWASTALFVVGMWAAAACTYLTLKQARHEVAGVAAGTLILTAPPLISLRGMETALYLAIVCSAMLAMVRERSFLLGALLALAILARPDAVVVAVVVIVWEVWQRRWLPWRVVVGGAVVLLPWLALSVPLTGSMLPSTMSAKIAQAESGQWAGYFHVLFATPLQPGMSGWFVIALPLAVMGTLTAIRQRTGVLVPLTAATIALITAYGAVLQVAGYAWYVALPVLLLTWVAGVGLEQLVSTVHDRRVRIAVAAVLGVVAVAASAATPRMLPMRQQYEQVGAWLRTETPPEATVASVEIGRLGYYSDRTMVDYLGLLDATAIPHVRNGDWTWWITVKRPDYWVGNIAIWGPDVAVRDDATFRATYQPVMYTADLVVYGRIDRIKLAR